MGKQLIRAKKVERRLGIARAKVSKEKREKRAEDRLTSDWTTAADALKALEEQHNLELKKLTVPTL